MPYVTDKGFEGEAWHAHWREDCGAEVITPPKRNSRKPGSRAWRRWLAGVRQIVETVIGSLHHLFRLDPERPHELGGFAARVTAKMALHKKLSGKRRSAKVKTPGTQRETADMSDPSDLTDAEWALIEHHFQPKDRRSSASKHPRKRIVDAILYVAEGGIKWRMLPKDFPPWQTVYDHFSRWNKGGVWETALDALNARRKKGSGRLARATASSLPKA